MERNRWLKFGISVLLAVLMVGSVFAVSVAVQPGNGKEKIIYQRNSTDKCINPSSYIVTVKNHETVDIKFSKDGKCIERISKYYSDRSLPKLDSKKYVILRTKKYSKSEERPLQVAGSLSDNSETCVATSRYTDIAYKDLTTVASHHTFTYDGTYITSESGYVEASYFNDGWGITSGPTFYFGPTSLPATSDYSVGQVSFSWLFNQWPHTQINQINVDGDGVATATENLIGDTVPGGHFLGSLDCS